MGGGPRPTAVVFDLDGTLVQTRVASWQVFSEISDRFRLGITEPEQFFSLFDGNLYASLRRLCRSDEHAAEVKEAFLAQLGTDYRPWLVPGMSDVVRRLAGVATLAVMSSNATEIIRRILTENELALCFSHVFGGDVNESKERGLQRFMADATFGPGRRCEGSYDEYDTPRPHEPEGTVLVTDTIGDVREARAAGVRAVGVSWGMHTAEDLLNAGAEFVALWPQELLSHLLGDEAAREPQGACALPTRSSCDIGGLSRARSTNDGGSSTSATGRTAKIAAGEGASATATRKVAAPCSCGGKHWSLQARPAAPDSAGGGGPDGVGRAAAAAAVRSQRARRRGEDVSSSATRDSASGGPTSSAAAGGQAVGSACCGSCKSSGRSCSPNAVSPGPAASRDPRSAKKETGRRTAEELRAAVRQICG